MSSLLHRLDPVDIFAKPKVMEYIGPIFAGTSLAALHNAIEGDGDIFHEVWMSLPEAEQRGLKDDARPYRGFANLMTTERIARWVGEGCPEHVALIQVHPKGSKWLSKCIASLKVDLLT